MFPLAKTLVKFPHPNCLLRMRLGLQLNVLPRRQLLSFHVCRHPPHLNTPCGQWVSRHWCKLSRYSSALVICGITRRCSGHAHTGDGPPLRVLFLGTDQYALHHLKALHLNRLEEHSTMVKSLDVAICTDKCPVQAYAKAHSLTTHRWPLPELRGRYDVGVIVSFGHLIPASVITSFPLGILNVHPSLLPAWRGASPLINTVLTGDTTSGISIMSIHPKRFDTGPLLAQKVVSVPARVTSLQLVDHMAEHGVPMLLECLANINTLQRQLQLKDSPTPRAHKLKTINAYINWEIQGVHHIDRQYRAISEMRTLRTYWGEKPVKLLDMVSPVEFKAYNGCEWPDGLPESALPGTPVYNISTDALWVRCKDGWVAFRRIVLKKIMSVRAFHNGYLHGKDKPAHTFTSINNGLDYFWR